jgi:hypothetical protein
MVLTILPSCVIIPLNDKLNEVMIMNGFTDRYVENKTVDFQKIKDSCGVEGVKMVVGEMGGKCIFIHVLKLSFFRKKTVKIVVF